MENARSEAVELVRAGRIREALEVTLKGFPHASSLGLACALLVLHRGLEMDADAKESLEPYDNLLDAITVALHPDHHKRGTTRLRKGGRMVSFGRCDHQLGYLTADSAAIQTVPRRIDINVRITKMSTSVHHSVAIDTLGRIWTWGHGQHGRLGLGDERTRIEPEIVRDLSSYVVIRVAAGKDHTLAVTRHGLMFAWGSNEKGQLGLSSARSSSSPRRVKLPYDEAMNQRNTVNSLSPGGLSSGANKEDRGRPLVRFVAASPSHSIAIDQTGRTFAWGNNDKCQAGQRDGVRVSTPRIITSVSRTAIDQACAAEGVTYLLSKQGDVMQIGLGLHAPSKIRIRVRNEAEGEEEEEATADWAYGGRGGESSVRISFIACGPNHAAAVSRDGMLFTWGTYANLLGHAGKGCNRDSESAHTVKPRRVTALRKHNIVSVSCSRHHTCAVDTHGNLYTWGDGERGALGTSEKYQPTPTRVDSLRGVSAVSAADSHTVALLQTSKPSFSPLTLAEVVSWRAESEIEADTVSESNESEAPQELQSDLQQPQIETASTEEEDAHDNHSETDRESLLDEDEELDSVDGEEEEGTVSQSSAREPMSLQLACEDTISQNIDLWNVVQFWEFADRCFAVALADFCKQFVSLNLDAVLAVNSSSTIERIAALCDVPLFDLQEFLHDPLEGQEDPSIGLASPPIMPIVDTARLRSGSVVSIFSVASDFGSIASDSGKFGSPLMQPRNEEAELTSMSVPRLRKRLDALEKQLAGVSDMQLKIMASTPDRHRNQARRSRSLEEQKGEITRLRNLIENELNLRAQDSLMTHSKSGNGPDPLWCRTCNVHVNNEDGMIHHVAGKKHRRAQARQQELEKIQMQEEKTRTHGTPTRGRDCENTEPRSGCKQQQTNGARPWYSPQVAPQEVSTPRQSALNLRDIQQEEETRKLFHEQRLRYQRNAGLLPSTPQRMWAQQVTGGTVPAMSLMDSPKTGPESTYLSPLQSRHRSGSVSAVGSSVPASPLIQSTTLPPSSSSMSTSSLLSSSPLETGQSARRGVSLSDYMKPKTKPNNRAPWAQSSKKASKPPPSSSSSSGAVLQAMQKSLDLNSIQLEQQAEKASGRNQTNHQVSSWGLCTRNSDRTLSDIQNQQALEMESERLAMELAAMEGIQQDAIFERSLHGQNNPGNDNSQNSGKANRNRSRRNGNTQQKKASGAQGSQANSASNSSGASKRAKPKGVSKKQNGSSSNSQQNNNNGNFSSGTTSSNSQQRRRTHRSAKPKDSTSTNRASVMV